MALQRHGVLNQPSRPLVYVAEMLQTIAEQKAF